MEVKKKFYMECHLAGRMYHDADEVWDKLKVGTLLHLERDLDNRYDPDAVAVMFHDNERDEAVLIGYIPRAHNSELAAFLEMGWSDAFECRINSINPETHPERQIRVTIKIKRNN